MRTRRDIAEEARGLLPARDMKVMVAVFFAVVAAACSAHDARTPSGDDGGGGGAGAGAGARAGADARAVAGATRARQSGCGALVAASVTRLSDALSTERVRAGAIGMVLGGSVCIRLRRAIFVVVLSNTGTSDVHGARDAALRILAL